ncbi:MAG: carboxypeptidase-like regulatory domain-containing protein [Chitinophagaceae bacterium]|nr:carboxypeptidase-like regulatory domain-containing protein [Chitinophagaceae bacterium]
MKFFLLLLLAISVQCAAAQTHVQLRVADAGNGEPLGGAQVTSRDGSKQTLTGRDGRFRLELSPADDSIRVSAVGYHTQLWRVNSAMPATLLLQPVQREIDAVVVSGTLRPMSKLESPVPV